MNLLHGGLASTIKSLISQINGANALHGRNGSHALTWGITEFNISYAPSDPTVSGIGVCSFFNGQFFAEYYGVGMQLGAQMMNSWSVFENNASCGRYDHGYLGGSVSSPAPRSSYYHTQLLSKYLKGGYLTSSSGNSNVGAIATCSRADLCEGRHEDRGQDGPDSGRPGSRPRKRDSYLAVMVLNEDSTDHSFYVSMDNGTTTGTGDTAIRVSANLANAYSDTISANTTYVLVFDRSGKLLTKVSYSLADDENGTAPTVQRF